VLRRGPGFSAIVILIVAMTVVATCFGSALAYFLSSTVLVSRETEGMLWNAVPSADHLSRARAALRLLDGALDRALLSLMEQRPLDRQAIISARRQLEEQLAAYRHFPYDDFEADLNRDLDASVGLMDEAVEQLVGLLTNGKLQAAHEVENGAWRRQSDRVDDDLQKLISFNINHVARYAKRIDRIRRQAVTVGITVGALGVFLALGATLIAVRAVRRSAVLQEERAAELEMFSARVAHDLTSPLSVVSMALGMNQSQLTDERAARTTTAALNALKRVRTIVDGLLDFARAGGRPPTGARAAVQPAVRDVLEEVRPAAEAARIELACDPVPPCEVACAPGVLTVVITNLVNNAIKFMGEATVRRIDLKVQVGEKKVRFEVRDTGPGFPSGFEKQAFQAYVRGSTDVPGLGLGLATVKRLVEAHGGSIGAARPEGGVEGGAVFWFELKRSP
jgi:signal transduction histidine kinase